MNKAHRLIKKLVALAVVLFLSIESIAAVVGDNDGAAFITKAEFESLKNDFQTQINRYNTSLDSKIDGAIASYISGINIAAMRVLTPRIKDYTNIKWMNGFYWKARNVNYTAYNAKAVTDVGWEEIPYIRLRQIRQKGFRGWWMYCNDIGVCPVGIDGKPQPAEPGSLINGHGDGVCLPTPFWRLVQVDGNYSYVEKNGVLGFAFESTMEDRLWGAYMINAGSWWNEGSPQWWGFYGYAFQHPNTDSDPENYPEQTPVVSTPSSGEYLRMKLNYWHSRSQTTPATAEGALTSRNANLGSPRGWYRFYNTNWAGWSDSSFTNWISASDVDWNFLPYKNAHFPAADNTIRNNLTNVWKYFLLGQDDDNLCNVAYVLDDTLLQLGIQTKMDFSSADTVTVDMNNFRVTLYNPSNTSGDSIKVLKKQKTIGTVKFAYPLFPQIKHRDLTNGLMLIDGITPAKVGDGLPLVKEVDGNGTITFKGQGKNYNVENTSTNVSDQKVKLYIKKGDFKTHNASEFYTLENGTTSTNGYSIADFTKETTFKVPVKKGDEIWMRVSPNTTNKYIYTQLSKLDMTIEYD